MKRLLLNIVVFISLITCLVGCGKQNKVVEENAQKISDAFASCDMDTINETIFGVGKLEIDNQLSDMWSESIESQEGILKQIFEHVTIKINKITASTIEYQIKAPDMKNVFVNFDDTNTEYVSEGELLEHVKSYVQNADISTVKVNLEYVIANDEPVIDYRNEVFINAVTGGLLDAYKVLYEEMMEEYLEGVK